MWSQIISELFVNLSAGWFGVVFIDQYSGSVRTSQDVLWLIFKVFSGILSLFVAKIFREKALKRRRR